MLHGDGYTFHAVDVVGNPALITAVTEFTRMKSFPILFIGVCVYVCVCGMCPYEYVWMCMILCGGITLCCQLRIPSKVGYIAAVSLHFRHSARRGSSRVWCARQIPYLLIPPKAPLETRNYVN